jgi:hypothetical protein
MSNAKTGTKEADKPSASRDSGSTKTSAPNTRDVRNQTTLQTGHTHASMSTNTWVVMSVQLLAATVMVTVMDTVTDTVMATDIIRPAVNAEMRTMDIAQMSGKVLMRLMLTNSGHLSPI